MSNRRALGAGRRLGAWLALLAAAFVSSARADGPDPLRSALRQHAGFLLSTEVGKRAPGGTSLEVAAAYAASELERAGLPPIGGGRGARRTIRVELARSGAETSLEAPAHLTAGKDYRSLPVSADAAASGPFVFAGYGRAGGADGRDDYADLACSGGVVLVVDGGPPGAARTRGVAELAAAAAARGAAAVLVASDPRLETFDEVTLADGTVVRGSVQDRGTEFLFLPRGETRVQVLGLKDVREVRLAVPPGPPGAPGFSMAPGPAAAIPVLGISARGAEALLGRPLVPLLDGMDTAGRPASFVRSDLRLSVVGRVERRSAELPIVLALRPGADPARRGETVVVAAALDGAGGGAALLLAAAGELARRPAPARSVLFVVAPVGDGGALVPAVRRLLPVPLAAVRGVIALEATGREPGLTILSPGSPTALRSAAARAGIPTALTFRDGASPFGGLGPKGAVFAAIRAPRPDGSSAAERADLDAVRLGLERVRELANPPAARVRPEPAPPAKSAPGPAPPAFTLSAAHAARLAGQLDRAKTAIEGALEASPGNADLYLERGRIRLAAGDAKGARQDAGNLDRLHPGDGRAWLLRSEILFAAGEQTEALSALEKAGDAGCPEGYLRRGLRLLDLGQNAAPEARRDLAAAAAAAPDDGVGLCARAVLALERADYDHAIEWLDRAVEDRPELASAWYWRGMLAVVSNRDPELAVRDFDRALLLGADRGSTRFNRGLCLLRLKKYTLAIEDFEACIALGASAGAASYNVACAHALIGDRNGAFDWLGRAMGAGFDDVQHARADPDLESIRDDPRFEEILKTRRAD